MLKILRRIEDALLAILLTAMIGVAATQVIMRNLFDGGLLWGDSAVRVMVLWVALVGAMVASRTDAHIRIDIAGRFLSDSVQPYVSRFVHLFTTVVLVLFSYSSFEFVRYEYIDGTTAFGSVPAWLCEAIIPIGTGIMALRYALHTVKATK